MRERPILFSGPMVRAILEGRKTQTRRVVTPQPDIVCDDGTPARFTDADRSLGRLGMVIPCPYGVPGDRLWVRETWAQAYEAEEGHLTVLAPTHEGTRSALRRVVYRADNNVPIDVAIRWHPAIHMKRIDCRLKLEVLNVRVERLQDISERDCLAEGIGCATEGTTVAEFGMAKRMYRELWDSINAKRTPWASNPWVWVVEFRKEDCRETEATPTTLNKEP